MAEEASLGRLMAQEMGKPVTEARGEVRYAVSFVEWYAEEAKRVYGTTIPSQAAHKRLLAQPQPVGPVYAITPWNFPAAMITRKAAPGAGRGLHGGGQARRAVAAHRGAPGRTVGVRRRSGGRLPGAAGRRILPRCPGCSSTIRRSAS